MLQVHQLDAMPIPSVDFAGADGCGGGCAVSDLLQEDEEPFEVLPGGRIGPCLYAALRILCADDATFDSWTGITGGSLLLPLPLTVAGFKQEQLCCSCARPMVKSNM